MLKLIANLFKSNQTPEIQVNPLITLIHRQQTEINQLINKVNDLEKEVDKYRNSIYIDVKINEFKNKFYESCIGYGLTKSKWYICYKTSETDLIELMEQISNKILMYANSHLKEMLQRYKDELTRPDFNSSQSIFPIDKLSEKHFSEFHGHQQVYESERIIRDNHIIKMQCIVAFKKEKLIQSIVEFIDNILSLF